MKTDENFCLQTCMAQKVETTQMSINCMNNQNMIYLIKGNTVCQQKLTVDACYNVDRS